MSEAPAARCFVCGARGFRPTERALVFPGGASRRFRFACPSCGVLVDEPGRGEAARAHAAEALRGARFASDPGAPYGLDVYTLRTLASGLARRVAASGEAQALALREPHSELAADAVLRSTGAGASAPVTLAILCRREEAEATARAAARHLRWTRDVLVLADADGVGGLAVPDGVRLHARPLGGDFGAQRDAAQDLARNPWVLQLDADETAEEGLVAALGWLVEDAEDAGIRSVGFRRRNLVDGVAADLWPDTQYRLNRREVRFGGTVHERPVLAHWRESWIALPGAILHHLSREHVEARSRRYEAMAPGGGRLFETEALLRPFRP